MTPEKYAQAAERIARVLRSLPPDTTIIGVAVDWNSIPSIHAPEVIEGAMLDADHFGVVIDGVRVFRCTTAREKAAWVLGVTP